MPVHRLDGEVLFPPVLFCLREWAVICWFLDGVFFRRGSEIR
jgi:hypothetical protein